MYITHILYALEASQKILELNDWNSKTFEELSSADQSVVVDRICNILSHFRIALSEIRKQIESDHNYRNESQVKNTISKITSNLSDAENKINLAFNQMQTEFN